MANFPEEDAMSIFNLRSIGSEPKGATPITDEDLEDLIPDFVATRADLNQVEFENIVKALPWARNHAKRLGPEGILDFSFIVALHQRMFGDVWKWAGTLRRRLTNIGIEPQLITTQSRLLIDDAKFWHAKCVYEPDELAARIHCRLVSIHPFTNGNGRVTRMVADLYLVSIDIQPFTWGSTSLDVDGSTREQYIAALVRAVGTEDYEDLIHFARS
ncbi:MAG: mobile mystery protein B [Acidimicrobiales bacterium]|nr:mobile mystery protein B [Acidimicrobiales bacterium]